VLWISDADFDAESEAARLAEREPGFVHVGTVGRRWVDADLDLFRRLVIGPLSAQSAVVSTAPERPRLVSLLLRCRGLVRGSRPSRPDAGRVRDAPRYDGPGRSPAETENRDPALPAPLAVGSTRDVGRRGAISVASDGDDAGIGAHVAALRRALGGRVLPEGARVFGFYNLGTGEIAVHVQEPPA